MRKVNNLVNAADAPTQEAASQQQGYAPIFNITFNAPIGQNVQYAQNIYVGQDDDGDHEAPLHLPEYFRQDEAIALYRFLIQGGFIDGSTSVRNFLFAMGCSVDYSTEKPLPVQWLKTKEQLRTLLEEAYRKPIEAGSVTKASLERAAPSCFVDKQGGPMKLANRREENSLEIDKIRRYFQDNAH